MSILIAKFICLLLAATYGYSNTLKAIRGFKVTSPQVLLMAIGVSGFIMLQWVI